MVFRSTSERERPGNVRFAVLGTLGQSQSARGTVRRWVFTFRFSF